MRVLGTAVVCAAAIIGADTLFRTSVLRELRPVIISPPEHAVMTPPVEVRWDGPAHMDLLLSIVGEEPRDLGVLTSPVQLAADQFPRNGGYQIELRAPRFGSWVRALRWFQVQRAAAPVAAAASDHAPATPADQDLLRVIEAARTARDQAQERNRALREENTALHAESDRLSRQIDDLSRTQEAYDERQSDLENRLAELAQENRALADENAALRARLNAVIPCTVWGYFTYAHPLTIPLARRLLMVSDLRGQVFRAQLECEANRRLDPTALSVCFCVGSSFGG